MKRKLFVLTAVILSNQLFAQQDTSLLDEAVITANKYPSRTSTTGKVVTVITRAQLEQSGSKDLSQVLSEQAGIYIAGANSNTGKDKSLYLRGGYASHTLITIDGIPVYDPSGIGGNFDIRNISLPEIERIEILKGSQSTLYGSDAMNGVINIITRKNTTGKEQLVHSTQLNTGVSYGSFGSLRAQASVNGSNRTLQYNSSYSYTGSRGMNEAVAVPTIPDPDKDAYHQHNFAAGAGFTPLKGIAIKPFFRFSKIDGAIDQGAFTDEQDYTYQQQSWQAGIRNEFDYKKHHITLLYSYNAVDRRYTDDSVKSRNGYDIWADGQYKGGEHFTDLFWVMKKDERLTLSGGIDYRASNSEQTYSSIGFYGPYESKYAKDSLHQQQGALYAALNWHLPNGFNVEAGSRLNLHSTYGSYPVFSFNPSWLINKRIKLYANLSSAYRTPSLYQLFSEYGNNKLKPESAITTEAGLQYFSADHKLTARITGFDRNVKDILFFYFNSTTFQSQYINQDKQHDHGIEFESSVQLSKQSSIKAWYTHTDGKIRTITGGKDTSYFNLLRRPRSAAGMQGSTQIGKHWLINSSIQWNGKREDAYFDNSTFATVHTTLKAYVLWNLYTEYAALHNRLKLFADLRNITNTRYIEISGFNTSRFTAYAGFRYQL